LKLFGLNLHGISVFELESVLRKIFRAIAVNTQRVEEVEKKSSSLLPKVIRMKRIVEEIKP